MLSAAAAFRCLCVDHAERPGGLVVTPWGSAYTPAGWWALAVGPEGTATGGLVNATISFMQLPEQRVARAVVAEVVRDTDAVDVGDTACTHSAWATTTHPSRSGLSCPVAEGSTRRHPPMRAVGGCGSSTPPPGSGPALTTSPRLAAGPSTSSGRAGSTSRSPPPTRAGIKPAGPRSPSGGSPSPRTGSVCRWPVSPVTSTHRRRRRC